MVIPSWKTVLSWIGRPSHVLAVGAFALAYNSLEFSLYGIIINMLPDESENIGSYLYSTLNNRQRVDLILRLSEQRGGLAEKYLRHAMKCFDICSENRNLILHATADFWRPRGALVMVKSIKNTPGDMAEYIFPLKAIREAAMSACIVERFICRLQTEILLDDAPPSLPETPPLPRILSQFRRQEPPENE